MPTTRGLDRHRQMNAILRTLAVGCLILMWAGLVGVGGLLYLRGPRTIAQAVAPDGTEIRLIQRSHFAEVWQSTRVAYRRPAAGWMWLYYGHEDVPWIHATITFDPSSRLATVYRGGTTVAVVDVQSGRYAASSPKQWGGDASPREF